MTTIKTPVGGRCLPLTWYKPYIYAGSPAAQVCPDLIAIACSAAADTVRTVINLAGRGWMGVGCAMTDPYIRLPIPLETWQDVVSYDSNSVIFVDVWQALRDAIWASSVTIEVRVTSPTTPTTDIYTHARNGIDNEVHKAVTAQSTLGGIGCGSVLKATITVNDDGTFSIA